LKLPNIKYLAGDKSKLKAIKTWGVIHAAALVYFFTRVLKFCGSEDIIYSSCVGSHCFTLLDRFGGARLLRDKQAWSGVLSVSLGWWSSPSAREAGAL
jgi:hypothetical protein